MDELKKLLKNRTAVLLAVGVVAVLGISLVSFLVFGSSSKTTQTTSHDTSSNTKVGVLDETSSNSTNAVLDRVLGGLKGRILRFSSEKDLRDAVSKNKVDIALIFTFGFSTGSSGEKQLVVTVYYNPSVVGSSQLNDAVNQAVQNYSQEHGQQIVVQAVVINPPNNSSGGSTSAGGNSGSGNSSSGENVTSGPRRIP